MHVCNWCDLFSYGYGYGPRTTHYGHELRVHGKTALNCALVFCFKKYKKKYIGFAFNNTKLNKKKSLLEIMKVSKFIEKIGLYSSTGGQVLDSGWQTKIENLSKNLETQWLPTSATIFKKKKY